MTIPMDYVVVTKNGESTISATIDSIRSQNNVNRVIVVASSDSRDEAKRQLHNLQRSGRIDVLRYENTGLAFARYLGIMIVETPWFSFIDDDIVLPPNWSAYMENYIEGARKMHMGAFVGQAYMNDVHREYLEQSHITHTIEERMFTHNTAIRTDLVSNWKPDFDISAYEDYNLTQFIISKNAVCMSVPLFVFHDHQGSDFWAAVWAGAGARRVGAITSKWQFLKRSGRTIAGGMKRTWKTKNQWFLMYAVRQGFGLVWGYLRWKKYNVSSS